LSLYRSTQGILSQSLGNAYHGARTNPSRARKQAELSSGIISIRVIHLLVQASFATGIDNIFFFLMKSIIAIGQPQS
jgi:hypothetical protein